MEAGSLLHRRVCRRGQGRRLVCRPPRRLSARRRPVRLKSAAVRRHPRVASKEGELLPERLAVVAVAVAAGSQSTRGVITFPRHWVRIWGWCWTQRFSMMTPRTTVRAGARAWRVGAEVVAEMEVAAADVVGEEVDVFAEAVQTTARQLAAAAGVHVDRTMDRQPEVLGVLEGRPSGVPGGRVGAQADPVAGRAAAG